MTPEEAVDVVTEEESAVTITRLLRRFVRNQEAIMTTLAELQTLAQKTDDDISTALAARDATIAAQAAQIADLQAQLAALQNDQAAIDAVAATLTEADGKVAPPPAQ